MTYDPAMRALDRMALRAMRQEPEVEGLKPEKPKGKWFSRKPEKCDVCSTPLSSSFIGGRTAYGPWAIMCPLCHVKVGVGLGTGCGQKYDLSTLEKIGG